MHIQEESYNHIPIDLHWDNELNNSSNKHEHYQSSTRWTQGQDSTLDALFDCSFKGMLDSTNKGLRNDTLNNLLGWWSMVDNEIYSTLINWTKEI